MKRIGKIVQASIILSSVVLLSSCGSQEKENTSTTSTAVEKTNKSAENKEKTESTKKAAGEKNSSKKESIESSAKETNSSQQAASESLSSAAEDPTKSTENYSTKDARSLPVDVAKERVIDWFAANESSDPSTLEFIDGEQPEWHDVNGEQMITGQVAEQGVPKWNLTIDTTGKVIAEGMPDSSAANDKVDFTIAKNFFSND